jgi:hypothetical protein
MKNVFSICNVFLLVGYQGLMALIKKLRKVVSFQRLSFRCICLLVWFNLDNGCCICLLVWSDLDNGMDLLS